MTIANSLQYPALESTKVRTVAEADDPAILTDIYRDDINIAIWRRSLSPELQLSVQDLLKSQSSLQLVHTLTPENAFATLKKIPGLSEDQGLLAEDIAELLNMFCCLFDLKSAGLRLTALNRAMCPRFHVDRIPCRLITTYQGVGTEWLPHSMVNREKLGAGNRGLSDEESGLFQRKMDIQRVNPGDVALLKGELWEGNEGAGLVHRSPSVLTDDHRLLLTLDFVY